MVEPRRKHGAFDLRYPLLSLPPAPTWVLRVDVGIQWTEFLARFFSGRHRHDIEALAAYGAYRRASTQQSVGAPRAALQSRRPQDLVRVLHYPEPHTRAEEDHDGENTEQRVSIASKDDEGA
jgi:hypothetical protein